MAIAFVQTLLQGGVGTAGATTSLTGSKTVSAGNAIVLFYFEDKLDTSVTATDNLGNTYELLYGTPPYSEASTPSLGFWVLRALDIAGGTLTQIDITQGTNTFSRGGISYEYSGMGAISVGGGLGDAQWATNAAPTGTAIPTSGVCWWAVCSSGDEGTVTAPTGYTYRSGQNNGTGSSDRAVHVAEKIGTVSAGSLIGSFGNSVAWVTGSAFSTEPVARPALAGISFDGVTVR